MLAQRRRILVDQIEQPVLEAAIKWIDDRGAVARSARHVEGEVDAHGGTENDTAASGRVRHDGLTVERDHQRPVVLELEREDPRVGGVDQTQPQPLAGTDREGLWMRPLTVTVLPTRPLWLASIELPKSSLIWASGKDASRPASR